MSNSPNTEAYSPPAHVSASGLDEDPEADLTADLDWEWIYDENDISEAKAPSRKRKATGALLPVESQRIVGARQGRFQVKSGETFVLQAGPNELWVALLHDFVADENGDMLALFQWLSPPKEIRNRAKRRTDALPVGLF